MKKNNINQKVQLLNAFTVETKLGKIDYTNNDIFYFNEGLLGFPNKIKFSLTDLPGTPKSERYGLLQSLEDTSLSFIVHYPALDENQQFSIHTAVKKMTENETVTKDEIGFAFLVITNPDKDGQLVIDYVTDAPLVFVSKTQEAWQMVNHS
jgi:flagellar assembly factor FliW